MAVPFKLYFTWIDFTELEKKSLLECPMSVPAKTNCLCWKAVAVPSFVPQSNSVGITKLSATSAARSQPAQVEAFM